MARKSSKQLKREKLLKQSFKKRGKTLPQKNLPVHQHYVPQWYQKRFIPNGNDKYFYLHRSKGNIVLPDGSPNVIEKVSFLPPKKCFVRDNLYTIDLLGARDAVIEKHLFGRIDTIGSQSFKAIIEERGWCQKNGIEHWRSFLEFMDAQKLRTPKGLDWIRQILRLRGKSGVPFFIDHDTVLASMQQIRQMHSTMWTESIWEVVSAQDAVIKFIISDDPVTIYNHACSPNSAYCRYPLEPLISLIGTRTIFPLDLNHCLILTNRQYALNPDNINPLEERINPRYFDKAIFNFLGVIRERILVNEEVSQINYIIKARASSSVAAGKREWLYPEKTLNTIDWKTFDKVILPPRDKVVDTHSIFFGHKDGSIEAYDPYGQEIKDPKEFESIKKVKLIIKKKDRNEHFCHEVADLLNKYDNPNLEQQNNILLDAIEHIFGLTKGIMSQP